MRKLKTTLFLSIGVLALCAGCQSRESRESQAKKLFDNYFDSKFCYCGVSSSGSLRYFTKSPKHGVYFEIQNLSPMQNNVYEDAGSRSWNCSVYRSYGVSRTCFVKGNCGKYERAFNPLIRLNFIAKGDEDVKLNKTIRLLEIDFDEFERPTCKEILTLPIGNEFTEPGPTPTPTPRPYKPLTPEEIDAYRAAHDFIIQKAFTWCGDCSPPAHYTKYPFYVLYEKTDSTLRTIKEVCEGWVVDEFVDLDKVIRLQRHIKNERNKDDDLEWTGSLELKWSDYRSFLLLHKPCSQHMSQRSLYTGNGGVSTSLTKMKNEPWQFGEKWSNNGMGFGDSLPSQSEIYRCRDLPLRKNRDSNVTAPNQ